MNPEDEVVTAPGTPEEKATNTALAPTATVPVQGATPAAPTNMPQSYDERRMQDRSDLALPPDPKLVWWKRAWQSLTRNQSLGAQSDTSPAQAGSNLKRAGQYLADAKPGEAGRDFGRAVVHGAATIGFDAQRGVGLLAEGLGMSPEGGARRIHEQQMAIVEKNLTAPETVAGEVVESFLKVGAVAATGAPWYAVGAGVDMFIFDPKNPGLTDMMKELPEDFPLKEKLLWATSDLALHADDNEIEAMLRRTVEGFLVGVAVEGLVWGVKAYRQWGTPSKMATAKPKAPEVFTPSKDAPVTQELGSVIDPPAGPAPTKELDFIYKPEEPMVVVRELDDGTFATEIGQTRTLSHETPEGTTLQPVLEATLGRPTAGRRAFDNELSALLKPHQTGGNPNTFQILDAKGKVVASARVDVAGHGPNGVSIELLQAAEAGTGVGGKALDEVIALADKHGVDITLSASPTTFGKAAAEATMSQGQLENWYRLRGFERTSWRNHNMVRRAGTQATEGAASRLPSARINDDAPRFTTKAAADRTAASMEQDLRVRERAAQAQEITPEQFQLHQDLVAQIRNAPTLKQAYAVIEGTHLNHLMYGTGEEYLTHLTALTEQFDASFAKAHNTTTVGDIVAEANRVMQTMTLEEAIEASHAFSEATAGTAHAFLVAHRAHEELGKTLIKYARMLEINPGDAITEALARSQMSTWMFQAEALVAMKADAGRNLMILGHLDNPALAKTAFREEALVAARDVHESAVRAQEAATEAASTATTSAEKRAAKGKTKAANKAADEAATEVRAQDKAQTQALDESTSNASKALDDMGDAETSQAVTTGVEDAIDELEAATAVISKKPRGPRKPRSKTPRKAPDLGLALKKAQDDFAAAAAELEGRAAGGTRATRTEGLGEGSANSAPRYTSDLSTNPGDIGPVSQFINWERAKVKAAKDQVSAVERSVNAYRRQLDATFAEMNSSRQTPKAPKRAGEVDPVRQFRNEHEANLTPEQRKLRNKQNALSRKRAEFDALMANMSPEQFETTMRLFRASEGNPRSPKAILDGVKKAEQNAIYEQGRFAKFGTELNPEGKGVPGAAKGEPGGVIPLASGQNVKRTTSMMVGATLNNLVSGFRTFVTVPISGAVIHQWEALATVGTGIAKRNPGRIVQGIAESVGYFRWMREGAQAAKTRFLMGYSLADPHVTTYRYSSNIGQNIETGLSFASRGLAAGDEYTFITAYRANVWGESVGRSIDAGTTDLRLITARAAKDVEASFDAVTGIALNPKAAEKARIATLSGPLGSSTFGGKLTNVVNDVSGGPYLLKFLKTDINIFRYANKSTPLISLAYKDVRDVLRAGGKEAEIMKMKWAMTTAVMAATFAHYKDGHITGNAPTDAAARNLWLVDNKENSVRFSDTGEWHKMSRFEPIGSYINLVANTLQAFDQLEYETDDQEAQNILMAISVGLLQNLANRGWLQDFSNFTDFVSNPTKAGMDKMLKSATSAPAVIAQFNTDPYMREARGIVEQFVSTAPGLHEGIPLKYNPFGESIMRIPTAQGQRPTAMGVYDANFALSSPKKDSHSFVETVLLGNHIGITRLPKRLSGLLLSDEKYRAFKSDGKLASEAMQDYIRTGWTDPSSGEKLPGLRTAMADLILSPEFNQGSEGKGGSRDQLVQTLVTNYREAARDLVLTDPAYAALKLDYIAKQQAGAVLFTDGRKAANAWMRSVIDRTGR